MRGWSIRGEAPQMSDSEQDRVVSVLADGDVDVVHLTLEQMAEVELARREARQGLFASDQEMADLWCRFGA
jgi:hypothetical protein